MSERRMLFLRNGLVAGCAFAAIVLLASFYSIVSGAVDRAARQRLAAADASQAAAALLAPRPRRPVALLARSDN
jgi:hypothetical protein